MTEEEPEVTEEGVEVTDDVSGKTVSGTTGGIYLNQSTISLSTATIIIIGLASIAIVVDELCVKQKSKQKQNR